MDFEQLRIENQSLIDKIEERNDELISLRRKTTNTVQVRTVQVQRRMRVTQPVSWDAESMWLCVIARVVLHKAR